MSATIRVCFIALGFSLAACGGATTGGGGGGGGRASYVSLSDGASVAQSSLTAHRLDPSNSKVSAVAGVLDRQNDRLTIGGLAGGIDNGRTLVTLDGGGSITITGGATSFVSAFSSQPAVGNPTFGVLGVPTIAIDLPTSGNARYIGTSGVQIIDGSALYDLVGSASVDANFASGIVNMSFSNLDGTRSDGVSAPISVTDVAVVRINNAVASGGVISGGTAGFSSAQITTALSGAQIVSTSGGFYGPGGDEVGGVFIVNDTSGTGLLLIQGVFTAD